jgi:hypothetical protein
MVAGEKKWRQVTGPGYQVMISRFAFRISGSEKKAVNSKW